jgi:DNA-binding cell septation regulator SpoVG
MEPIPTLEVRVRRFDDVTDNRVQLLAFAELTIGGAFTIKSIRVLAKREGSLADRAPFVVFPAERRKGPARDRWFDVAHPCTPAARAAALAAIVGAYRTAMAAESVA